MIHTVNSNKLEQDYGIVRTAACWGWVDQKAPDNI